MKKILTGIFLGIIAGLVDVTPMFIAKLPWSANISAFSLWVIAGFFVSTLDLRMPGPVRGILTALLIFIPSGALIAESDPKSIFLILFMILVLGGLLGFFFDRLTKRKTA